MNKVVITKTNTKLDNKILTKYVSAFVLGDGSLRTWKNVKNAAYAFAQVAKHKNYVMWQADIISNITSVNMRYYGQQTTKDGVNHQDKYVIETRSHPFFTTLRSRWYIDGKKTVSPHDLKQFDWECAAIWYMDDGYILKSDDKHHKGNVFLCTDCFSFAEVSMLQKLLYEKLNIPFDTIKRGFRKDGSQIYRLRTRKENAQKFLGGIEKFIFSSFEYKLSSERLAPNLLNIN